MFDIKETEVVIINEGKEEKYKIRPLNGEYFSEMFGIIEKMKDSSDTESLKADPETIKLLHKLITVSLKESYPNIVQTDLERFVTQNMFKFVEPMIRVNIPQN